MILGQEEGENIHLKGTEPAQAYLQGFCSRNLGSDSTYNIAVMAAEQRGGSTSHRAPALAPPSPASSPTKVTAASTP